MTAKPTLLRLQPWLSVQHGAFFPLRPLRQFATSAHNRDEGSYKFDEDLAPPPPHAHAPSSSSIIPALSTRSAESHMQSASDSTLSRTVFVRTKDGKHLISVVHTLSLLSQLASKFGPIQQFHFPRESSSQRLLGYGSVTFFDKESLQKALDNDGIHSVVLPPIVPSRAPRSYLTDKEHARLVGMGSLMSCNPPSEHASASQTYLSSRSLQNPAAMRPGWNDVAPLCNMEAATLTRYFVDESKAHTDTPDDAVIQHNSEFYLSTSPVPIDIKIERRITPLTSRPNAKAQARLSGHSSSINLHRNVRAALQQFGGFSNVIKEKELLSKPLTYAPSGTDDMPRSAFNRRHTSSPVRSRQSNKPGPAPWQSNRTNSSRRSFSTSAINPTVEGTKAKRKAEWQRNRHSNFVDQLYLRLTGGKGGDGCVSFHREKFVQFGPPSGGNGGAGGSIYIRAVEGPTTLARISRRFRGADGPHGQGSFLHGKKAEDKYIELPVGTVVTATRRLRIPEEEEAEEYFTDLLKRAAKAKWDPTGVVAKEDAVFAAEEVERKRLARLKPSHEIEHEHEAESDAAKEEAAELPKANKEKKIEQEEEEIDGEDFLEPDVARQLQALRERVWRHYPRAEETNYRRNEFRAAEMRLALDRRRRRRYIAQSQAAANAASSLTHMSSTSSSTDQSSAASVTPYEDAQAPPTEELWRIDLDEPTSADSPGILLASGGRGGLGNPTFLSSSNRSPKFATRGEWGESLEVMLELKRPSDIGLVGLPNAGKSTILRSISASKAQVGHWRFTTLSPNLGVVRLGSDGFVIGVDSTEVQEGYGDDREAQYTSCQSHNAENTSGTEEEEFRLVLSDIPGLIDGAADNRGLGHTFLRHIERCSILAYVLDLTEPEPWKDLKILHDELGSYREDLPTKAKLVIVNKADMFGTENEVEEAKAKLEKVKKQSVEIWEDHRALGKQTDVMKMITVSAKKKQGTQGLAKTLFELLRAEREAEKEAAEDENKWGIQ
ncbi:related to MTG2 - Mitochondrial GTP binding protein [Melanopsichium pennsylvanicum]|uniref:Related to MTG2 - Mitochondrial GTP binding protein n=2 Tax=Melanopsichium pennsylvanicum TaxID=63383 RepID=A0AAJ4XLH8_9BASI|nr:related to MTG2-Mitochondrial GTP binding protein [Melanopsichium pennsylvanicum 4]SNX83951.1 related to MTG2 - Mitochondrial GTP binding protein [Melanopsichium pennsylvanicum]